MWILELLDIQKDKIISTIDGNKIKLKCLSDKTLIGSAFKLVCTVDGVKSELIINIVGGV